MLPDKIFIRNPEKLSEEEKREKYGVFYSIFGILLNIFLFCGKFIVGLISGAISITADAFNNLTDALSSVVTLFGFKLASKKPDADHPFGHGRFEYIAGFIVSMLILMVGFELGKGSVEKIIDPQKTVFSAVTAAVLVVSVIVKLYMAYYNFTVGKRISSGAMKATAVDCLSDSIATSVVLVCMLLSYFFEIEIDAYCGLAVSLFIIFSGIRSANETISPLLGQQPTPEFVKKVEEIVKKCPYVCGVHDLIVHDYGPGRLMVSIHAEVPADCDLLEVHDAIDNAEKNLAKTLSCHAVIHIDPIQTDNLLVLEMKGIVEGLVKKLDPSITIHDFRMVNGKTHTNLIFDAVLPYDNKLSDKEACEKIGEMIKEYNSNYCAVIEIDRSYV